LTDGKGEPTASVFTIAYLAEPAAGERRRWPLSSMAARAASVFLHLGALGPRILDTLRAGGAEPADRPCRQSSTWLASPISCSSTRSAPASAMARGGGQSRQAVLECPGRRQFAWRGDTALADPASAVECSGQLLVGEKLMADCGRRRWRAACLAMSVSRSAAGAGLAGAQHGDPAPDIGNIMAPAFQLPSFAATAAALAGRPAGLEVGEAERFALSDYPAESSR